VKKINSLVSFAPGDNFLFSLGILRALYLILPFDIFFELLSFEAGIEGDEEFDTCFGGVQFFDKEDA
jgi:hypothetical protein